MKKVQFNTSYKIIAFIKSIDLVGFRWLSHRIPKLLIPKPTSECIVRTIHGFDIIVNPLIDKGLETNIYYTGTYEFGTLKIIANLLKPGETFVDVGANIGLMSLFAAQHIGKEGKVFAVEANPDTLRILEKNIELNSFKNIQTIPFALGSSNGTGKIYTNLHMNRGSASLVNYEQDHASFFEISIKPLDEILDKNTPISLIKIDIEGYELEALKGMKQILNRENPPCMIIECGEKIENTEYSKENVFQFIQELNNFQCFKLSGGKGKQSRLVPIHQKEELPSHDNMICIPKNRLEEMRENKII